MSFVLLHLIFVQIKLRDTLLGRSVFTYGYILAISQYLNQSILYVSETDKEGIGPGGFACATQGGVAMCSWPLFLPTFCLSSLSIFFFLCLLLLTHFTETPEAENLFPPIFWYN